ncbi:15650_t:CDS:1, partial [Gigaspora margarita]
EGCQKREGWLEEEKVIERNWEKEVCQEKGGLLGEEKVIGKYIIKEVVFVGK